MHATVNHEAFAHKSLVLTTHINDLGVCLITIHDSIYATQRELGMLQ